MKSLIEIERKWLIPGFPQMGIPVKKQEVYASYIHAAEDCEIRIQRSVNLLKDNRMSFKLTVKLGNGLIRSELETVIDEETYNEWLQQTKPNAPIFKDYMVFLMEDGTKLCVSKVDDDWFYAEVEFDSTAEAEAWQPPFPDWEEVTGNDFYQMKNYWRRKHGLN